MRRPPEPHYSFTLPSIHDDTTLDCRIFHPNALKEPTTSDNGIEIQWRKQGVVMAHPYAPMGGSYDDRIVAIVVEQFLKLGWVVGTFNFRGAHGSKGSTSWSGKPELDDYTSFAAFFIHYMCYLQQVPPSELTGQSSVSPTSASPSSLLNEQSEDPPVIILGGYSYGSLIVKHLPPIPTIIQPFTSPSTGSAAEEILLRARKLADQSNLEWINIISSLKREGDRAKTGHEPKLSITIGGEETSPDKRRSSKEIRRSLDGSRSRDFGHKIRNLGHKTHKSVTPRTPEQGNVSPITMPHVRYLLISPLTPPLSMLAAPALVPRFWSRSKDGSQEVIGKYPSLAIFGDQDIFTSAKKTRDWAEQLKAVPGSQFTSVEVENAGHFWVEQGVEEELRSALRNWEVGIRG